MKVDAGKMMFFDNALHTKLRITKQEEYLSPKWKEATDADLAEMGLVRKWRFDELSERLYKIIDLCIDGEPEQSTPHTWKVGDYARCTLMGR
jgi:hypothetical protein